jgi:DNA-binding NtrC family response regulator
MNKTKIMVVDDEIEILDMLKIFLSVDYEVITAENGLEAIEKFLIENPLVIITDINMPHMSGMELLKIVKEISPTTEIILMTGCRTLDTLLEAQKFGAFNCISKPFSLEFFQDLLHRVMDKINSQVIWSDAVVSYY